MSVLKIFRRMKVVRVFAWFFWLAMLVGHAPLWVRAGVRLIENSGTGNWTSFLTLSVSSLFFAYKLMGLRILPAKPSWRRTVVYCLLGAVVHVLVFCPSLSVDRFELIATLTVPATIILLTIETFTKAARRISTSITPVGTWILTFRGRFQNGVYIEVIRPLLEPIPIVVQSHRGPPLSFHVY